MLLVGCWGCLAGVAGGTHSWMLHPNVWASQHLGAAPQHMDHTPGWGHPLSPSHVFLLPPVLQWDWERAGTAQHPQPKELQHQLPAPPPFSFCTAVGSPLGTPSCTASPQPPAWRKAAASLPFHTNLTLNSYRTHGIKE